MKQQLQSKHSYSKDRKKAQRQQLADNKRSLGIDSDRWEMSPTDALRVNFVVYHASK